MRRDAVTVREVRVDRPLRSCVERLAVRCSIECCGIDACTVSPVLVGLFVEAEGVEGTRRAVEQARGVVRACDEAAGGTLACEWLGYRELQGAHVDRVEGERRGRMREFFASLADALDAHVRVSDRGVSGSGGSMRFAELLNPTEAELRVWAAEEGAAEPVQDWELVLAWGMEVGRLRVFVELAGDARLANAGFLLRALYAWVSVVARREDFEVMRSAYDRWLDVAKGVRDPAVKRWRNRARRVFQGIDAFDYEGWWAEFHADGVDR